MSKIEPTASVRPEDVERAARHIRAYLSPTPLQLSRAFSHAVGAHVHIKLESIHPIRSFKARGALNKLIHLEADQRRAGVITASAGNHGLGVAFAAAAFEVPATVFVPEAANLFKVEAIKRLGAHVVRGGNSYHDAYVEAVRAQRDSAATFVHAYDDAHVIAGQGTIGVELLHDLERFDTLLVPIGGGGLIAGIGMYVKEKRPGVRVIGVEPSGADAMKRSLDAGHMISLERVSTIADGLAASAPGTLTLALARRYVDEVLIVEEDEMVQAIRLLFEWEHLLAEPAGAATFAALLNHYRPAKDETVVAILSGANVTDEVMVRALGPR